MAHPHIIPARPSVPTPYVAGVVEIEPNKPTGLLELIHDYINRDCPGTSVEFMIWADPSNVAPVYVGAYMGNPRVHDPDEPGKLSAKSYAYYLTPMGEPRVYRSSYPGTSTPIGRVQVFSQARAKLHVEVME